MYFQNVATLYMIYDTSTLIHLYF